MKPALFLLSFLGLTIGIQAEGEQKCFDCNPKPPECTRVKRVEYVEEKRCRGADEVLPGDEPCEIKKGPET